MTSVNVQAGASAPAAQSNHAFDQATLATKINSVPEAFASIATGAKDVFYAVNLSSAFGNTPKLPNGGYVASVVLSAANTHQAQEGILHRDPLYANFAYISSAAPGEGIVSVSTTPRGSGFTDVHATLFQLSKKGKVLALIRASFMFGVHSGIQGMSHLPVHFGPVDKLEDVPPPPPSSWFLPPTVALISRQIDMLVKLETQRRPIANYFLRFRPESSTSTAQDSDSHSGQLNLRTSDARRIDAISLPMFVDVRRPALENVIKEDATSLRDEPTRKYAYPTLNLSMTFLGNLSGRNIEWAHFAWREGVVNGRVTTDICVRSEDGTPLAVGTMDSLMFDLKWYKL